MATYGKLRSTTISGQAGTTWYVQLWKKDYAGSSSEMTLSGEGFSVNWSGQGGTRDKQFLNSECVLNMYAQNSTDEDLIYDIFSKGDRNYYVRIYKNGESNADIWWFGWVNPSFSKIENVSFPYLVNIKATDSIGTFSKRKEDTIDNLNWVSIPRINSHIKDFGEAMGLYNSETELVTEGNFPDPSTDWDIQESSVWNIPSGGGRIDYNGTSDKYIRQSLSSSVVAGSDYTISFTISNLADGESAQLSLKNYNGQHFFNSNTLTYTSNGNYQVSGTLLYSSTGFRIIGESSGNAYSLTDVSVIEGLISNPSPCPTNNDWFQTSVDWWREGDTYQSDDPFYKYRATKTAFREEPIERPTKYKEYDVLKGVLQTFNTVGVLSEGKYNFIQPNSWRNNTSGILPFYKYIDGDLRNTSSESINNLLRVNGTEATILGGSTITFEPPLKEVTAEFKNTLDVVSIPTDQSANTELQLGYLDSDAGALEFRIDAVHTNKMLATSVEAELGVDPYGNDYEFRNCFIWLVNVALIKLTNGTDTYYLDTFSSNTSQEGEWSTSNYGNTINSGWAQWGAETGGTSTSNPNATYPCSISKVGNYYETIISYLDTIYVNSDLPISGDLSITLTSTVYYYKVRNSWNPNSNTLNDVYPFTSPSIITQSDILNSSSYVRSIVDEETINVEGVSYIASQDTNVAEESLDLGEITIGAKTEDSALTFPNSFSQFNVAYSDAGNFVRFTSKGFTRGNGSVYSNITQLLVNEFLQLQVEPLEILQADIYSSNISASKLLKYSINSDGSYNYYTFLGGKFSAQSETMSGEWYKVSSSSLNIIEETKLKHNKAQRNSQIESSLKNLKSETTTGLVESSLGVLASAIIADTATTSITLGSALKGDLAENQIVKLTMPNGANAKSLTVSDGYNTSATTFNTDSFTTNIDYPIGSIISVTPYEMVNLMNRLTTSGNSSNRSVGVNIIQEINFLPHDFNLTSNASVGVASDDLGGSIQIASATANMYAQKLISKGKTITKVNVFASSNLDYRVYEGFIFNDTTTLVGTGVANTELDITDIVGTSRNYITIQIDVDSASEKVYGGYALVTNT